MGQTTNFGFFSTTDVFTMRSILHLFYLFVIAQKDVHAVAFSSQKKRIPLTCFMKYVKHAKEKVEYIRLKTDRLLIRRVIRSTQVRPTPDNMSLKTCDFSKSLEKIQNIFTINFQKDYEEILSLQIGQF